MKKTFLVYKKTKECDIRSKFVIIPEFSTLACLPFIGSLHLFRHNLKLPAIAHLAISFAIFNSGYLSIFQLFALALATHFGLLFYINKIGYNLESIETAYKASNLLEKYLENQDSYTIKF
jgi:hypothetical protein